MEKVAAIKFRSNGKLNKNQFVRISSALTTALKQPHIKTIGILPPTWRNPSYCALGVIYLLLILQKSLFSKLVMCQQYNRPMRKSRY